MQETTSSGASAATIAVAGTALPLSFEHVSFAGDREEAGAAPAGWRVASARRGAGAPAGIRAANRGGAVELDPSLRELFGQVCEHGGISASRYRATVVRRRQGACLRALRASTVEQARRAIGADSSRADRALDALMIGVTSFFRDREVFEGLGRVLPRLAADRLAAGEHGGLRVLSVGCSDGSELYSVGIMLGELGLLGGSTLWGLDCRREAVVAGAAGVYPAEAVAGLDEGVRGRWFGPAQRTVAARSGRVGGGGLVEVTGRLKRACVWAVGDAFSLDRAAGAIPREFDVVLCRNMAIYLEPEASAELWRTLASRVAAGGVLVCGKAERPLGVGRRGQEATGGALPLKRVGPCIFRRTAVSEQHARMGEIVRAK